TAGRNWVTWNLGSVGTSASVTAILNVQVINDQGLMGYTVANTARLTGYQNTVYVDKSASAPTVSISAAPFTIIKTISPTYAQPGQYVSFGIKVKNNSLTNAVNNFTVTDNLDSRLVNPGVGAASSLAGVISGNQVYWGGTGTTIQPNTEMNFYFTAMVNYNLPPGTQIPNTAQVSGQIPLIPNPLPAGGSSNTVYAIVGLPASVSLFKSVSSASVQPGTPALFTITCSNPTTNPTVGVTIADTLPSPLTFQSATGVYTQSAGIVTWTATLNPGQTQSFELTALLAQTATIGVSVGNTAVASVGGTQLATSTATFTVGQVPASLLVISKLATADSALPGEPITYLITFANNGSSLLNNVQIIEYFPIGTAYLNGSPPPIIDTANNRVIWNIGDVTPGANGTVSVQFTVPAGAVSGSLIDNVAFGAATGYQDAATPSVFVTVGQVLHHGYIKGYSDGMFRPQNQITRAEVAAMLSRILGAASSTGANFSDLPTNHWAYGYVSATVSAGLFNGYPDGTFRPDQSITRAELSKVMVLMRNLFPIQVSPPTFPDIAGHWAANYIEMASRAQFVTGYTSGDFRPDQPITRAETVTLINRAFGRGPLRGANVALSFPDVPNNWMFEWVAEAAQSHYGVHNAIDNTETLISYYTEPMP
ncbi:MAG: S-layer homology domain-containing protein, partial [bacterium]